MTELVVYQSRGVRAAQRFTIRNSPQLLVAAALNANALTKGQLTGWFALCSAEADQLPRTRHKRRAGGHYFLYRQPAFEGVLGVHLADALAWEVRLELRRRKRNAARGPPRRRIAASDEATELRELPGDTTIA